MNYCEDCKHFSPEKSLLTLFGLMKTNSAYLAECNITPENVADNFIKRGSFKKAFASVARIRHANYPNFDTCPKFEEK